MYRVLTVALLLLVSGLTLTADTAPGFGNRRYAIQSGDVLQLSYRYSPEYDETLTVQPDGFVSLKLVGDVKLEGLTLDEARQSLVTALNARLNHPEITLTLQEFVRPSFVATGEVGTPGKYEMHGRVTLIEAVSMAGGLKTSAKHSQVILFRRVNSEVAQTRLINLKRLMDPNHPHLDEDVNIEPGDLIVVPKNKVSKISDYIHWVNIGSYIPLG